MDYSLIPQLLNRHIHERTPISVGAHELDTFLNEQFQLSYIGMIDLNRLSIEFRQAVKTLLTSENLPIHIQSLYFGLVTLAGDNDASETVIHLTGSNSSPEMDSDWACDVDYKNMQYVYLTDFGIIDAWLSDDLKHKGSIEVLIFNGLLNLLILSSFKEIKALTFKSGGLFSKGRQTLSIGAGFDSGDCYNLGMIDNTQ